MRRLFWASALPAVLALSGCGQHQTHAEAGIATQTLLVGNGAEPSDLDPDGIAGLQESTIDYALFENLTELDEVTSRPLPAAAQSWDISPDGLVYTFHLRRNGRWSDGTPVTADDFVYGIHRILSPKFAALYSYMVWPIKNAEAYNEGRLTDFSQVGIRALDPWTLRVTLANPTPYVLGMMTHATWAPIPRHVVERFGSMDERATRWTRAGNLVGNGAFKLTKWVQDGEVVVERNPYYWDAAHVRLHRIIFYPIESAEVEDEAFRAGQLDITYSVLFTRLDNYRQNDPQELKIPDQFGSFFLFLNVRKPPFDNIKVRQALDMAIDREAISRVVLHGAVAPGYSLTCPDIMGYTCRAKVKTDFEQARRLLAEAGYPGGRGLPPVEMLCYQKTDALETMESVQSQWRRQLGVRVSIVSQEFKNLLQNQQTGNYSIAYSGWIADFADAYSFLSTMVTGNGNNYSGWSNPEYDRLIDDSTRTADNARRYDDFQKAEALMLKQAPLLPIIYGQFPRLQKTFVRGYPDSPLAYHRWKNVWLER